jgi:hypothetical protein
MHNVTFFTHIHTQPTVGPPPPRNDSKYAPISQHHLPSRPEAFQDLEPIDIDPADDFNFDSEDNELQDLIENEETRELHVQRRVYKPWNGENTDPTVMKPFQITDDTPIVVYTSAEAAKKAGTVHERRVNADIYTPLHTDGDAFGRLDRQTSDLGHVDRQTSDLGHVDRQTSDVLLAADGDQGGDAGEGTRSTGQTRDAGAGLQASKSFADAILEQFCKHCVCVCVCVTVRIETRNGGRLCVCLYVHTYIHSYMYMHTYINTYIHTYTQTHIHTYSSGRCPD